MNIMNEELSLKIQEIVCRHGQLLSVVAAIDLLAVRLLISKWLLGMCAAICSLSAKFNYL